MDIKKRARDALRTLRSLAPAALKRHPEPESQMDPEVADRIKQTLQQGVYKRTKEVIRTMYERMPFEQSFHLEDGTRATITPFFEPNDERGYWRFGVDVKFDDDSLLEFTMSHTGGEQREPHAGPTDPMTTPMTKQWP